MINDLGIILNTTFMYSTPLIFASMGSIFSERSGVVNIGIEGLMTVGAFVGVTVTLFTHNPWLGILSAALAACIFSFLHSLACVYLQADQTISGIAINFLAPGIGVYACKFLFNGSTMTPAIPLEEKIPRYFNGIFKIGSFLDNVINTYATVYISFIFVAITWFILFKTRFGLRLRAVGEHPKGADTLGVSVFSVKNICVLASGALAGIGGASITLATVSAYRPSVIAGQGYIAIAAAIFGKYKPKNTMYACLLFGFCNGLAAYLGNPSIGIKIPEQILSMLPYFITLVVLFFVGKSTAPAASGKPYYKSS